jgi:hypothetical protein
VNALPLAKRLISRLALSVSHILLIPYSDLCVWVAGLL